ncbi:unnamed protein product [Darwinula stevensoni]|uniref:Uncharacterized protein n=1 Tax=Darwinula stevensoni TaxID=69355 RepID=A0A7R9FQ02_9CRUS|nr:unnamed protein product [Darwinula stevensoni]CAG0898365.1 unnamed protein product [Darwinula stevensoni]
MQHQKKETFIETSVSPEIVMERASAHRNLTYVDFIPECLEEGGLFSTSVYQPFSVLMARGNEWLARNADWEAVTCESLELKTSDQVRTERMIYCEHGERRTAYVRCLRLWLRRRNNLDEPPQQLGYVNCVPEVVEQKTFGSPKFLPLSGMIVKVNEMFRANPLPGKIITIETQEMKVDSYSGDLDPDRSYWEERGDAQKLFVFVIRIFFQTGFSRHETVERQEIGIVDFSPTCENPGGFFSHPTYESFSSMVRRMSVWCQGQSNIRITNIQSVEYKLKHDQLDTQRTWYTEHGGVNTGIRPNRRNPSIEYKLKHGQLDTQRTWYTEHGDVKTYYVRILRVAFVPTEEIHLPPYTLTCRTFLPIQLERGGMFKAPEYESMSQTRDRVAAWMELVGATLISAETSAIRLNTGGERKMGPEATYTFNETTQRHQGNTTHRHSVTERWIYVIRLYLDGEYEEPPAELLPPIPEIKEEDSCIII